VLELERDLVDRVDVARGDHGRHRQVGEESDLLAYFLVERLSERHMTMSGWIPIAAELPGPNAGRLRLQLTGMAEERHEREVDEHGALAPRSEWNLPQRLEEGQRLDVAHRAADLGDDVSTSVDSATSRSGSDLVSDNAGSPGRCRLR